MQRLGGECPRGLVSIVGLDDPLHERAVPRPSVRGAVASPLVERHDAGHTKAQAQDVPQPRVLDVGCSGGRRLDDYTRVRARGREDVGSEELVVLMFAVPHLSQRARM